MMNELKQRYQEEISPAMMEKFNYNSVMQVPTIEKIDINMGVGDAVYNFKVLASAVESLSLLSEQTVYITRAKRSFAGFRFREGMPIRSNCSLRGDSMYDFLHMLVSVSLPRVRDVRVILK